MVVLSACGMGKFRVLRAILGLALFIAIVQGSITLVLAPWAEVRTHSKYMPKSRLSRMLKVLCRGGSTKLMMVAAVLFMYKMLMPIKL